jgi:DNA modification methylase
LSETFLDGRVTLHAGDNRDVLRSVPDNSVDSIVTDPPYALVSIVKRFGAPDAAAAKVPEGGTGAYARASAGFMGKQWDTGDTVHAVEFWAECLRVLKPGGHLSSRSGTRTYHRMACAIEDAGFEIRDMIGWLYGSGFPKSHDVSKGIDRQAGAERRVMSQGARGQADDPRRRPEQSGLGKNNGREYVPTDHRGCDRGCGGMGGLGHGAETGAGADRAGAQAALEKTVAANVLRWGTGAINVDGCRVGTEGGTTRGANGSNAGKPNNTLHGGNFGVVKLDDGRWPANIIHDGSDEVVRAFPDSNGGHWSGETPSLVGKQRLASAESLDLETGSAARFFYTAKADCDDRLGSKHPTVKPVDLMQWLCRLVTPKGGTVLDPFAGTGTTGEAAFREGFNAVLIERERRIPSRHPAAHGAGDGRARTSASANPSRRRLATCRFEAGTLFAEI